MGCGFALIQVKKESRDSAELPKLAFAVSDICQRSAFFFWATRLFWLFVSHTGIPESRDWGKRQLCPWRVFSLLLTVSGGEGHGHCSVGASLSPSPGLGLLPFTGGIGG